MRSGICKRQSWRAILEKIQTCTGRAQLNSSQQILESLNDQLRQQFEAYSLARRERLVQSKVDVGVLRFLGFCQKYGVDWGRVQWDFVFHYLEWLEESYANRSILRSYKASLRNWLRFLYQSGQMLRPLHDKIPGSRFSKLSLRKTLTIAQVQCIFALPKLSTTVGIRNRALYELLYGCALRAGELVALSLEDVDFSAHRLVVRTSKNFQGRVLPIPSQTLQWLTFYLKEARPKLLGNGSRPELFLSSQGSALSTKTLCWKLRQRQSQKLPFDFCLHQLRHSCATHLLEAGVSVGLIREFLGHRSIAATQIYTQASFQWVNRVFQEAHPRA